MQNGRRWREKDILNKPSEGTQMLLLMPMLYDRLAEKYSCKRVEETAREHWLEMGMLSVTFTAYTAPDGLMVIDA